MAVWLEMARIVLGQPCSCALRCASCVAHAAPSRARSALRSAVRALAEALRPCPALLPVLVSGAVPPASGAVPPASFSSTPHILAERKSNCQRIWGRFRFTRPRGPGLRRGPRRPAQEERRLARSPARPAPTRVLPRRPLSRFAGRGAFYVFGRSLKLFFVLALIEQGLSASAGQPIAWRIRGRSSRATLGVAVG